METPSLETDTMFCLVNKFVRPLSLCFIANREPLFQTVYRVRELAEYSFWKIINSLAEWWMLQLWMTPILAYISQSDT